MFDNISYHKIMNCIFYKNFVSSLHGLHDVHLKNRFLTILLSSIFRIWSHAVSTYNFNLTLQTRISLSLCVLWSEVVVSLCSGKEKEADRELI